MVGRDAATRGCVGAWLCRSVSSFPSLRAGSDGEASVIVRLLSLHPATLFCPSTTTRLTAPWRHPTLAFRVPATQPDPSAGPFCRWTSCRPHRHDLSRQDVLLPPLLHAEGSSTAIYSGPILAFLECRDVSQWESCRIVYRVGSVRRVAPKFCFVGATDVGGSSVPKLNSGDAFENDLIGSCKRLPVFSSSDDATAGLPTSVFTNRLELRFGPLETHEGAAFHEIQSALRRARR